MSTASRSKKPLLAVAVIIVIIVAGIGVYFATQTTPSTPVSSSTTGVTAASTSASMPTTLVVDEASVPSTNDPGAVIDNNGLEVAQNTNLPLVFCANASCTNLVPVVASSWTSSADGLTYTFLLRNGVTYSNGDPFNAYVVWYNIYRDLYINQAADFIFFYYFNTTGVTIDNVNALNNPQNTPDSNLLQVMQNPHNSVTVLNASAVQFHLTNPFVPFMTTIETSPWVFVDPYVVQQHGGVQADLPNSWMALNGTTVGNGPYITQSYVPSQYNILVANPNYWAQNLSGSDTNFVLQPAKISKVIINYKLDELTRSLDLETGKSQGSIITFDDIARVKPACPTCYVPDIGPSGSMEWITIDMMRAPLNNTLVRRALIAAVNVTQIQQTVYNGYSLPVIGPMPTGFQYYDTSIQPPVYDVNLAKQLLVQAGYPNGQGLRALDYYYYTSTYQALVAQIVKADLAQVGITINLHEISQAAAVTLQGIPGQNATAPDMQAQNWTYYPDFSAYEALVDQRFGAYGNMRNDTIYQLILKSNTEIDPTARGQEISQITRYVQENAATLWLGQDIATYDTGAGVGPTMFNKCVTGMWYNTAFNGMDFNTLYYTCAP